MGISSSKTFVLHVVFFPNVGGKSMFTEQLSRLFDGLQHAMRNSEEKDFLSLWRVSPFKFQFTGARAEDIFKPGVDKYSSDITEL